MTSPFDGFEVERPLRPSGHGLAFDLDCLDSAQFSVPPAPALAGELRIAGILLFFNALNGAQTGALSGFEAFRAIARINLVRGLIAFPITVAAEQGIIGRELGALESVELGKFHVRAAGQRLHRIPLPQRFDPERRDQRLTPEFDEHGFGVEILDRAGLKGQPPKPALLKINMGQSIGLGQGHRAFRQVHGGQIGEEGEWRNAPAGNGRRKFRAGDGGQVRRQPQFLIRSRSIGQLRAPDHGGERQPAPKPEQTFHYRLSR